MCDHPDLLPCPFCGGTNVSVRETGNIEYPWEAFCFGSSERACDAAMWGETEERAAEEWNRRAPAPAAEAAQALLDTHADTRLLSASYIRAAMWDFIHDDTGRHPFPASFYDGPLIAALTAISEGQKGAQHEQAS